MNKIKKYKKIKQFLTQIIFFRNFYLIIKFYHYLNNGDFII
jgi:hypothetical protein